MAVNTRNVLKVTLSGPSESNNSVQLNKWITKLTSICASNIKIDTLSQKRKHYKYSNEEITLQARNEGNKFRIA